MGTTIQLREEMRDQLFQLINNSQSELGQRATYDKTISLVIAWLAKRGEDYKRINKPHSSTRKPGRTKSGSHR